MKEAHFHIYGSFNNQNFHYLLSIVTALSNASKRFQISITAMSLECWIFVVPTWCHHQLQCWMYTFIFHLILCFGNIIYQPSRSSDFSNLSFSNFSLNFVDTHHSVRRLRECVSQRAVTDDIQFLTNTIGYIFKNTLYYFFCLC